MGSLLKLCKPFFLTRLSSLPRSPATAAAAHLGTRHRRALAGPRNRRGSICSSSPCPSRPREYSSERGEDGADGVPAPAPAPAAAELRLFNTMSRKKEAFRPRVEGKVGMYVCGVTAYDLSHIGHARVYVTFDVLYRCFPLSLKISAVCIYEGWFLGVKSEYEVCYVRNFTDVDDKIIARANELGEDPISLSKRYCEEFRVDMMHLHCLPPSVEPRVSDHMPQIIDMIKKILDNGCAYQIDRDVYFSVDKFPEYGQLSGRKLEDNRAGERVAVDSRKKNPADFALWKSAKEGEPFWESPWGPGRPGWHIECSAMSATYLGYSFDIHGGGMDLVFPHHENEIAQSCAACRKSNISYWIHNGFVTVDSEKMSKSLGNFFTIRQVIELYHPLALRLFLLGTHYRSPINYSDVQLESASERIYYMYQGNSSERGEDGADGVPALAPAPAPAELRLFNTMSRKKEAFRPRVEGKVGMYVCGVTAYDLSHIGHARVYVTFDVLYRYLKNLEYEVCYVRNFTDVDDKIIARANELGEDPISLSKRYCEEFRVDMMHLHCLPPSVEPRVSDHMPQIIDMIKKILDNGCAYQIDGDVCFSVDKFPEYGQLSGRKLEDNRAGERVAVDSRKKNPADFALWKSAKEGEPFWESPWGPGRPGWHIECSAMSATYLGYSFDIHGGGMDLVFPHHENEIAQSCAACRKSNISYWIHNGFVTVDSEKMSKSLGNFFTIRQVIELYHPLALRLFLLGTHYRSPINYSDVQLESASERIYYMYQTLYDCENVVSQHAVRQDNIPSDALECITKFENEFVASMCDDLHTPVILAALSDPLKNINDLLHTRKGRKQKLRMESLAALEKVIRNVLTVLGLLPGGYLEVLQQLREKALKRAKLTEEEVLQKIGVRTAARNAKEYDKSDAIRKDLATVGIALMDSPNGTTWRPSVPLAMQEEMAPMT
ncbi:hypothetical protein NL676_035298 [Syzygium grande]|nr:hypothetical protein NL676_035298 [Syzygium grande]